MIGFKHLRRVDVGFYRRASFRLTSLHEMARREDLGTMHDPMEGMVAVNFTGPVVVEAGQDPLLDRVFRIPAGAHGGLQDIGIRERLQDFWIWCASTKPDAEVSADYDAVVVVSNMRDLGAHLAIAMGRPVAYFCCEPVRYGPKERAYAEPAISNSPFLKPQRFEGEHELRLVWPKLESEMHLTSLQVTCLPAQRLMTLDGHSLADGSPFVG